MEVSFGSSAENIVEVATVEQRRSRRLSKPRTSISGKFVLKPNSSAGDLGRVHQDSSQSTSHLSTISSPALCLKSSRQSLGQTAGHDIVRTEAGDTCSSSAGLRASDNAYAQPSRGSRLHRKSTKFAKKMNVGRSLHLKSISTIVADGTGGQTEPATEPATEHYEWIKEKALRDHWTMKHHNAQTGIGHPQETAAPIRRKSLLTPGIATRGNDILRKPPLPQKRPQTQLDVQLRYYNPSLSAASPLGYFANLDGSGRGRGGSLDTSRANTPAELDYGRIGGLRIANGGAVSPALASVRSSEKLPRQPTSALDVYETTSEGGWSDAETVSVVDAAASASEMNSVLFAGTHDAYAEDAGNPWTGTESHYDSSPITTNSHFIESIPILHPGRHPTVISACSASDYGDSKQLIYHELGTLENPNKHSARLKTALVKDPGISPDQSLGHLQVATDDLVNEPIFSHEYRLSEAPQTYIDELATPDPRSNLSAFDSTMAEILESISAASRLTPLPRRREEIAVTSLSKYSESGRPELSATDSGYVSGASLMSPTKSLSPSSSISRRIGEYSPRKHSEKSTSIPQTDEAPISTATLLYYGQPRNESGREITRLQQISTVGTTQLAAPAAVETSVKSRRGSPVGKKLQKRPPRPKSMPPPVERIIVTGCTEPDDRSAIPNIPLKLATRNAQRRTVIFCEEREPTLPLLPTDTGPRFSTLPRDDSILGTGLLDPLCSGLPVDAADKGRSSRPIKTAYGFQSKDPQFEQMDMVYRHDKRSGLAQGPNIPPILPTSHVHDDAELPREDRLTDPLSERQSNVITIRESPEADSERNIPIDWEKYRQAWAMRRKSAGIFLNSRPDFEAMMNGATEPSDKRETRVFPRHIRSQTADEVPVLHGHVGIGFPGKYSGTASTFEYIDPSFAQFLMARTSLGVSQNYEEDGTFPGGRYEGGLAFGYEPGRGVGGSAGTRNSGIIASRKSGRGNLARGFGVDLSDVPVFISACQE